MILKSLPLLIGASVAFVIFASLLLRAVTRLLRSNREQFLARAPVVADQELNLPQVDDAHVLVEVPRFGSDYRNWQLELTEIATGEITRLRYEALHAQGAVYGVTTMRVPFGRVLLSRAGCYRLRIAGLESGHDYSSNAILFSRPYLGRMVMQIVAIVFSAIATFLSLLVALWQILPLKHS